MKKATLLIITFLSLLSALNAQNLLKSKALNVHVDSTLQSEIYQAIDSLFAQIANERLADKFITTKNTALTKSIFKEFRNLENTKSDSIAQFYQKQLINFYPLNSAQYSLKIAYINTAATTPVIKAIIHLIAETTKEGIKFSLPLNYLTRHWQSKKMGQTTYFYEANLNEKRAIYFDAKNTKIATKLGVQPESFNFYLCDNYQDILALLGFEYDVSENGTTRNGYGVDENSIFSINHNEDFSHDIFHYYSGQVNNSDKRNWITEEGIAYSWGNAYYTDSKGEMIEQDTLIQALKMYLLKNPTVSLLTLMEENAKIFPQLAPEVSARSTIASMLCDKVEKVKGIKGLMELNNCGRKPSSLANFLQALDKLLGINRANFEETVYPMIMAR